MPCLFLTESDVEQLIDMSTAIAAVEQAFAEMAAGRVDNVPRQRAKANGIVLHSMSAAAEYLGLVGWKQYTTTREGAVFHVGLSDQQTGKLIALIQADRLGQMRTGAVSGVAAKVLARSDADRVGLIGSGWQAESQLEAIAVACQIQRATVFSRSEQRRVEFARRMSQRLQIEVVPVDQPQACVEDQPIVVTATTSRDPVFEGRWLAPGTLICAVGSNWLNKSELDRETIRRADRIVCDSIAACQHEAGDFGAALRAGDFTWNQAVELADIVNEPTRGRRDDDEIILFKSVGLAIEDVALGGRLIELARQRGVGTDLPI